MEGRRKRPFKTGMHLVANTRAWLQVVCTVSLPHPCERLIEGIFDSHCKVQFTYLCSSPCRIYVVKSVVRTVGSRLMQEIYCVGLTVSIFFLFCQLHLTCNRYCIRPNCDEENHTSIGGSYSEVSHPLGTDSSSDALTQL